LKKIDLLGTFGQACRDITDFISKENMTTTILKQHRHLHPPEDRLVNEKIAVTNGKHHHHNHPPGVFTINNVTGEEFDFDSDEESTDHPASWSRQRQETASTS
jgi:hypothetical protein